MRSVGGAQLAYRLPLQFARRISQHARGLQAHQLQMRRMRDHQAHGRVVHQRLQLQLQPADFVGLVLAHLAQAVQGLPQRGGLSPGMGPGHAPAAFLGMAWRRLRRGIGLFGHQPPLARQPLACTAMQGGHGFGDQDQQQHQQRGDPATAASSHQSTRGARLGAMASSGVILTTSHCGSGMPAVVTR